MSPSHPTAVRFPTTDWSMLARTGDGGEDERRQALAAVLSKYLPVIRAYLRAKWKQPADRADDLAQDFVTGKALGQDLFAKADRRRGRFRTFLTTALDHFVISELRRPGEPGGGLSLEQNPDLDVAAPAEADAFDLAWAKQSLELSVDRVKQECDAGGRQDVWAVFEGRVLAPALDGAEPVPLGELVRRLGLASPERASNLLITAKRMFARHLRAVVGEYAGEDEVEDEIRRLRHILSRAGA